MKLKKISQAELDEILKQHQEWINSDGTKGDQADLSYTDLSGMNLIGANLQGANLGGANLQEAYLLGADLSNVNLQSADLSNVNLQSADLSNVNLHGSNLQGVDLRNDNLRGADLQFADLQNADLQGVNLQEAKLSWVNWHEVKGIKVYVAGLQSSRKNAQLTYIPSIDVSTTGCWQGTWQETVKRIHSVYAEDTRERKAYDLAIEYIQAQMDLDDVED